MNAALRLVSGPLAGSGALVLLLALAGCSGFTSKADPTRSFVLRAATAAPAVTAARSEATLSVLAPLAAPGLAGTRVAVLLDGDQLDAYRGAQWAADLQESVQSVVIETLRRAGVARNVLDANSPFNADWLLRLEIRHFESVEQGAAPSVHVAWQATLGRRDDRLAVATLAIDHSVATESRRLSAVITAFQQATDQSAADLVQWVSGVLAAQP
ncbi:MAG: ABC-type transport auxiliary lipoprotein family protein [Steroidobacteraceae bacterium]